MGSSLETPPGPVLVTGASGFVGWHVARLLAARGWRVRALVRPTSALRELDVERVVGDLRDETSLRSAVEGCCAVFHVAADYRLWVRDPHEMYQSNVEGTRNLLEAARRAGVSRVVYTSTVGCIGFVPGGLADEESPVGISRMAGDYKRSKFMAEQVALEYAAAGFPVVIVNPTAPVGDHDFKPTPTGKIILDFVRGRMPAFVDTGLNLVDVEDVAMGHLLAYAHGRPGRRYILGGENLTLEAILGKLASICGRKAPRVRIPYLVALAAGAISTGWGRLTGRSPAVPLDAVRMSRVKMWVTHKRAETELGYSAGPVDQALAKAVAWFQSEGYC